MKQNPRKDTYPNNLAYQLANYNKPRDTVAFNANISRTIFTALMQGKRQLTNGQARKLAKAIGCKPQDLFIAKSGEAPTQPVAAVKPVAETPVVKVVPTASEAPAVKNETVFSNAEINELVELVQREIAFMRSTGRNVSVGRLDTLVSKLEACRSNDVLDEDTSSVISMSELAASMNVKPTLVPRSTSNTTKTVKRLSRPWNKDELSNVLSALRNGMTNAEAAEKTKRPIEDISNTKALFGWMWHDKRPKQPSKSDVDKMLVNMSESTKEKMFVTAQLSNI